MRSGAALELMYIGCLKLALLQQASLFQQLVSQFKIAISCLATWIVSLSGVRIHLMFQVKALQICRTNLMTSLLMLRGRKKKHGLDRENCRKKWHPSRKNWKKYNRNTDRHVSKQQSRIRQFQLCLKKCNLQLKDQVWHR